MLPSALSALAAFPQFILWRIEPSLGTDKKPRKVPVDPRTLTAADPHLSVNWLPAHAAYALAQMLGAPYGVGFVLTKNDPFWFLDIDRCLQPDNTWSPLAISLCQRLAGAAIEISHSSNGLHIIGSGAIPPHRKRNTAADLELYSEARFIALTGTGATGDAGAIVPIVPIVNEFFALDTDASTGLPAEWTEAPCAEWTGPEDDDTLLRLALRHDSPSATFGAKATFRQLWEGDETALSHIWPDGERPYNASSADSSLATRLAFWTGKDCARVKRLMLQSGLVRDKWSQREDYLDRTILGAVSKVTRVFSSPRATAAPSASVSEGDSDYGPEMLCASDMAEYFKGCVYIEDRYAVAAPDGTMLSPQQFRTAHRYGGRIFPLDSESRKTTRNAWEAFTECTPQVFKAVSANSTCFRPEEPSRGLITEGNKVLYNRYIPVETPRLAGDAGPFLRHVEKLLPDPKDRQILLSYMASLAQNPGAKFQWTIVLQGCEGNGKSVLIECLIRCVGPQYSHTPNAQDISNKFNAWLDGKLFIGVEEIYVQDRRDMLETLKVLITNRRVEIQAKGSDQITGDNRANFFLCTNHPDAVPKTLRDRRYSVLLTAQQEFEDIAASGMDGDYFPHLYDWLRDENGFAIVNNYLRSFAIPAELDPAHLCHRAPETSTTSVAIAASQSPVEQAIIEAIDNEETGFRGCWVSSTYLSELLDRLKMRNRAHPNTWDGILRGLGYVRPAALSASKGRLHVVVAPDGKRPRVWVKDRSVPALNSPSPTDVARNYAAAQAQGQATAAFGGRGG